MKKSVIVVPAGRLVPARDCLYRSRLRRARAALGHQVAEPAEVVHWAGYFLVVDGTHRAHAKIAAGERKLRVCNRGPARSAHQVAAIARAVVGGRVGIEAFLALRTYNRDWTARQLELGLKA